MKNIVVIHKPAVPIAEYPGKSIQVEVKFMPMECISKELKKLGEKYYQYTAVDEYTKE